MKRILPVLTLSAALALSTGLIAQAKPQSSQVNPGGCPIGFKRATPPLNPQLGCVPVNLQASPQPELAPPSHECPPGFKRATPPLNPQLGCLPTNIQTAPGRNE